MDGYAHDTFSNDQVPSHQLPSVGDLDLEGLDKRYLTAELLGSAIFWTIFGGGGGLLIYLNLWEAPDWLSLVLIPLLLLLIIFSVVTTILGFKRKKFALREKDIIYQSGLFWRTYTVLPFSRIQHVEVHQGPIERVFDLGKLKVYTAGGSSSDLSISGLAIDNAHSIKHFILNKSTKDEEE